jgi:hypothetical protein
MEQRREQDLAEARKKGWMPQRAWKGGLSKMVGRTVVVGWTDTEPTVGIVCTAEPDRLNVFFPEDCSVEHWITKDQIFGFGEKVFLDKGGSNKLRISFETGIVCDVK